MDNGYFSASNIESTKERGIQPYIATGCEAHYKPVDQLATEIGKEIYRLRKCTVEPVIGIIKEILGFRQFSLRGPQNVTGKWCLVCLAFNLKRMHSIWLTQELY